MNFKPHSSQAIGLGGLFASLAGLGYAIYSDLKSDAASLVLRDLILILSTFLVALYFATKSVLYSHRESKRKTNRMAHLKAFHSTVHNLRNLIFDQTFTERLTSPLEALENVSNRIATDCRRLFKTHYGCDGISIGEDLAVTFKLIVKSADLDRILKEEGSVVTRAEDPDLYLVTIARDDYNSQKKDREVRQRAYSSTANTAFELIINARKKCYTCNDLKELGENYHNENTEWSEHYNAAQAVPIRFKLSDYKYELFGILCIDSKNDEGLNLFNDSTFEILSHSADLLAIAIHDIWHTFDGLWMHPHPPVIESSESSVSPTG